jgi:NTE family protein
VGEAWEVGVLKGLREAGVDLTAADLFVGTSAGSRVATQVRAGRDLDDLYAQSHEPSPLGAGPVQAPADLQVTQELSRLWQGPLAPERTLAQRIEIGGRALTANGVPEAERVEIVATALGLREWPDLPLKIAAVDVYDGTVRFFDRTQGVPIARVVAASGATPGLIAPITVGARRYMDGGVMGDGLEGAIGYNVVVAVTPGGTGERALAAVERFRSYYGGQVVHVIPPPDSPTVTGFGDPVPAAQAGLRHGGAIADELRAAWFGGGMRGS